MTRIADMVLKIDWGAYLGQSLRRPLMVFWGLALIGFVATLSLNLSLDQYHTIQRGFQAQKTVAMLDELRRPMLDMINVYNRLGDQPMDEWRGQIDGLLNDVETRFQEFRARVNGQPLLETRLREYYIAFSSWKPVVASLAEHLDATPPDQHHLVQHLLDSNRQFLQVISTLDRGESELHQSIQDGHRAMGILALTLLVFGLWLAMLLFCYQRRSRLIIAARDRMSRTTLGSVADGLIATDLKGRVTYMNPAAENLTGWQLANARGSQLREVLPLFHPETGEALSDATDPGEQVSQSETTAILKNRNGDQLWVADTRSPILDEQARPLGSVQVFRDVSREQALLEAMEEQSQQLQEVQSSLHVGYWELYPDTGRLEWSSDETCRIFEVEPGPEDRQDLFLQRLHPDDLDHALGQFNRAISNRTRLNTNLRLLMPDGRIKHVQIVWFAFHEQPGLPLRISGTVQDITQRVHDERELLLAATTFQSHAGILITDASGNILRVNPAMEAMTGYSAEELIGQNPRMLKSGNHPPQYFREMWETVARDGQWSGELWNRRKDGSLYAEWLTITEVRDEYGQLQHYVGTSQDITERKQAEARIEHLAYHDELTNLPNRRLLRERLQQELAKARRHDTLGSILFIDLDHFKHLNDALGHPVGDELLRQMANRLQGIVREEDTVARLGGDEFIVLLPAQEANEQVAASEARVVANKILNSLGEVYNLMGHQYHMHVSIGIVIFPEQYGDADDVLKHADSALYQAKDAGRNTISFFQPSMQEAASQRLILERELRQALQQNDFQLLYQPQVDAWGRITGCEALIRWQHPTNGVISPEDFIPVAEDTGLIVELGYWVIREAVQQLRQWQDLGLTESRIAINLSARQFHNKDFPEQLLSYTREAGLDTDWLELEITESMMMKNVHDTLDNMHRLRDMGFRFSIDDFGTGYSSLGYLKQLPISQLKIDQGFVRDITNDQNDRAIVDTVIAMARHMGLNVIAEGVETREQLEFLENRGCPMFQGFLFSPPVNAADMTNLLRSGKLPARPERLN